MKLHVLRITRDGQFGYYLSPVPRLDGPCWVGTEGSEMYSVSNIKYIRIDSNGNLNQFGSDISGCRSWERL